MYFIQVDRPESHITNLVQIDFKFWTQNIVPIINFSCFTTGARIVVKVKLLNVVPRAILNGIKNVNEFILHLKE